MSGTVHCATHGEASETFVCTRILSSLVDGNPRGFIYTSLDSADEPCAYCTQCDEMLSANGDEWNEEFEERAEIKLLCYGCFMRAAALNGITVQ